MRFCFEKVRRLFRWFHSLIWKRRLELALVGLDDSGKTTFTNYLKNGRFPQHAMSTVGFHFQKIVRGKQTFKICDLGGLPRFRSLWPRYCMGQDAILFMLDAKNRLRLLQAKWELEQLMNAPQLEGIPLLVLANKTEYGGKGDDAAIGVEELANELALDQIGCGRPVGCIGISCKEGRNIDEALRWLLSYARH